jgi:hypothetical protein
MRRPLELASARCSKPSLPNQARLDRRDPRLGFTQRLGTCVHGVGAQDKVVIMRDSRAKYELCIGLRLEFDRCIRRPEGHQFALLQLVRDQNGAPSDGDPEHSVLRGRLVSPALSGFQTYRKVIHR